MISFISLKPSKAHEDEYCTSSSDKNFTIALHYETQNKRLQDWKENLLEGQYPSLLIDNRIEPVKTINVQE